MGGPLRIVNGRKFGCTQCGNCCAQPGWVYTTDDEIERMADHLGMGVRAFWEKYKVTMDDGADQPVIESVAGSGCPLLDDQRGCSVHPVKPHQCGSFPFWPELLDDADGWEAAKSYCPGIDAADGRRYSAKEIREIRDRERTDGR